MTTLKNLYYLPDDELGNLHVRINARAKNLIMRIDEHGQIVITVPPYTPEKSIRNFVDNHRSFLKEKIQHAKPKPSYGWDFRIEAPLFRFALRQGTGQRCQLVYHEDQMELVCPADTDFSQPGMDEWLRKAVETALVRQAQIKLPAMVKRLATQAGFSYKSVKISRSQGRWGSCSLQKTINLSCWLMMLPEHLIAYVILHELCHTIEMNHSDRFWTLLNRCTGGKALSLREELRAYDTSI